MGTNFADEIDLFDNIEDLIDFPSDNYCCNDFVKSSELDMIWNEDFADNVNMFCSTSSSVASNLSADLSLPYGDIPELEWCPTFKEESLSGDDGINFDNDSLHLKEKSHNYQFQTSSPVSVLESSSSTSSSSSSSSSSGEKVLPRGLQRARSKRSRPAAFNPRLAIHLTTPTSSFPETHHAFIHLEMHTEPENLGEKLPKPESIMIWEDSMVPKKKKKGKLPAIPTAACSSMDNTNQNESTTQTVRKCLHCEITKTPQWRAGPMGPKTLCNACGVRYKSGRLFPEYRPAASPTFVPSLHSNSHKKVIEMRSKDLHKLGVVADTKPSSSAVACNI